MNTDNVLLYDKVKFLLKKYIEDNNLKRGDKIPTEVELCEMMDASRITVRRAITELEEAGILEKIHGKGTFVKSAGKRPIHILDIQGFTEGLSTSERKFKKEILKKQIVTSDSELMKVFNRKEPFEVIELIRRIKDDHDIFSVDFAYIPLDLFPDIYQKLDEDVSTFKLMEDAGADFYKTSKKIEVQLPDDDIQELFFISRIDPVIKVKKIITDEKNIPIHFSEYYLLGERVVLDIESTI